MKADIQQRIEVEFIKTEESPQIGAFIAGERRMIKKDLADVFISRKLAKEVKPEKTNKENKK